jgi:hypothetical protein
MCPGPRPCPLPINFAHLDRNVLGHGSLSRHDFQVQGGGLMPLREGCCALPLPASAQGEVFGGELLEQVTADAISVVRTGSTRRQYPDVAASVALC